MRLNKVRIYLMMCGLLLLSVKQEASSQESCKNRDLVIVELDVNGGGEVMKINNEVTKEGASFDTFFKGCARDTAIIATDKVRISQISDILLYMGKVGIKPGKENTFIFLTSGNASSMVYLENFATIKYTNKKSELIKIIKDPPKQSSWI